MRTVFYLAVLCASLSHAWADDGVAALGAGGLVLGKSEDIAMVDENLILSENEVNVTFRFLNESDRDIDTLVEFPLPLFTPDPNGPSVDSLEKFTVVVDGVRVTHIKKEIHAWLKGKDITGELASYGIVPIDYFDGDDLLFDAAVRKLSSAQIAELKAKGFIGGSPDLYGLYGLWQTQVLYYWKQRFPAHKTLVVQHRYAPATGIEDMFPSDTDWRKHLTQEECVESKIWKALDKKWAVLEKEEQALKEKNPQSLILQMAHGKQVDYILTSANSWKGPIRHFRLTLKKRPDEILSTCFEGLKKKSSTEFVFETTNFTPTRELSFYLFEPLSIQAS